jgi:phosphoribosylaminoimidazole-succinocarboxamide synthase
MTLKDDDRGDPLITDEALDQLGIMTIEQYNQAKELVRNVSHILKDDLASRGLELYDIKFELAMVDGEMAIIDDISGGNMRVFKDGEQVDPLVLSELVAGK